MSETGVQVISPIKSFLAGGFGGACCITVGHPFDTIKVRLQTMPHVPSGTTPLYYGTIDCFKKTVAADGILGLYKGMGAPIAGVAPVFAICFFGYNLGKEILAKDLMHLRNHEILFAGMFSGIFSTAILAPGERIKCLLQVQSHTRGPLKYSGPIDVLRQLYGKGGLRSIFKGTAATLLRDVPASGVYFLSYELIKDKLRNRHSKSNELSVSKTLFAGGMAGIFNWIVAIPPDVLKSRLQSAPEGLYPNGIRSVFSELIAKEGFLALYKGMTPVMLRAFPANAACFLGYEVALKFLDYAFPGL
ncbi:Mitochondrial carnitine/acylcarnitine carrier protein [Schistosoma japonicum]|nr:Mitochondrial carnitine/acylcarnitine carrier protein [Schistosoma japonicum]KAH8859676.1 Mitochondrial carnitine/acylcarnitine carrier protein [Schistosoma japonicum]